jgi:hypothetical protein
MAREVYTDEKFIRFSDNFVFMRVLADQDPEGAELRDRYRVGPIPTLLILDSEGMEIDRIIGARPVDGLIEELELIFKYASESNRFRL